MNSNFINFVDLVNNEVSYFLCYKNLLFIIIGNNIFKGFFMNFNIY